MENPERLRPHIDDFLDKVFLTDIVFLYAPSQVALAATLHAASRVSANLDHYVTDVLFPSDQLMVIIEAVKSKLLLFFYIKDLYYKNYFYRNSIYCESHRAKSKGFHQANREEIGKVSKSREQSR